MWLLAVFFFFFGWMGNSSILNKGSFCIPCNGCVKRLTYFRIGLRLLGTHGFWWHTFSCSHLCGSYCNAAIHHLILAIIFATYLHEDSRRIHWRREAEEVDPHENVVLTQLGKTLKRILALENFMAGWDVKYQILARFSPLRPSDKWGKSWKTELACFLKICSMMNNWLLFLLFFCTWCSQFRGFCIC